MSLALFLCLTNETKRRLQSAVTDVLVVQGDTVTTYFDTRPAMINMVRRGRVLVHVYK